MKVALVFVVLGLLSVALFARDLHSVAVRERARREALHVRGKAAPRFTNKDLERYPDRPGTRTTVSRPRPRPERDRRDLAKERAYWRKQKLRHERKLARLDARIRKLEWRLAERRSRRRPGERLREDPGEALLSDSLESLRDERRRLVAAFHERARKAGALPGWLR